MDDVHVGQLVIYTPTSTDTGHHGAPELPAIVVRVWRENRCVNLKVFNDGAKDVWKRDISQGEGEGQWRWPPTVTR